MLTILFGVLPAAVQAQITNPDFADVSDTVGDGFNVGLALAVAAAVALVIFSYFFRAARRRG